MTDNKALSDLILSRLRTIVPILWGSAVTWLVAQFGWFPASAADWLQSTEVVLFVSGLVAIAWHWLFTKVEPHLPPWLTRLVLGSNSTPTYSAGE